MAVKAPALDNVKVFNTVRNAMSQSFRDRIPEATIENIADVGTMITSGEFQPEFNQWLHALVNRIGLVLFTDYTLENPLAKYIYGNMSFGDAIEEIALDIVKGAPMNYGIDGQSVDPFIKNTNQPKAEYHKIDEPIQYMTTVERDRIKRAFTENGGLMRYLAMVVNKLYSSANVDTWTLTKMIMADYITDSKNATMPLLATQKQTVADVVDEASGAAFIKAVKNIASSMKFPNNLYNPQKIHKTLNNNQLTLFVRYDILNTIGVDVARISFHDETLNLDIAIETMDDFGQASNGTDTDDVLAVLAEDNWLIITQQFEDMDTIWNPRGRYDNYFLTRQMSFGTSYFKDAVIFTK